MKLERLKLAHGCVVSIDLNIRMFIFCKDGDCDTIVLNWSEGYVYRVGF